MTDEANSSPPPHISDFAKAAYRSMLPGLEYAVKCMVQELNQIREKLDFGPVSVVGLGEGWERPKRGGITEQGRQKLAAMMRERWGKAKEEGMHVSQYKPPKKAAKKANKKGKAGAAENS